jgi:hypothetical protein
MTPRSDRRAARRAYAILATALLLTLGACGGGVVRPSHSFKANEHLDGGRPFEAIEEYRLALADEPTNYRLTYNLALAWHDAWRSLRGRGESEAAADALGKARESYLRVYEELDPGNARALCSLAVLDDESGDRAGARKRLESFIEGAGAEAFLPNYTLASLDLREKKYEAAAERLRRALNANPAHVPSAVALISALEQSGGSFEEIESVLDLVEDNNAFDFTLRKQRARMDLARAASSRSEADWRRARASLLAARQLNEADWEIALGLADVYEERQELRRAVYELWKAQSLIEDDRSEIDAEKRAEIAAAIPTRLRALYRRLENEESGEAVR